MHAFKYYIWISAICRIAKSFPIFTKTLTRVTVISSITFRSLDDRNKLAFLLKNKKLYHQHIRFNSYQQWASLTFSSTYWLTSNCILPVGKLPFSPRLPLLPRLPFSPFNPFSPANPFIPFFPATPLFPYDIKNWISKNEEISKKYRKVPYPLWLPFYHAFF